MYLEVDGGGGGGGGVGVKADVGGSGSDGRGRDGGGGEEQPTLPVGGETLARRFQFENMVQKCKTVHARV